MFELVQSIRIADEVATGVAEIAADHPGLLDHFPGQPLLPATWLVEIAAQIAGPLTETVARAQHPVDRWAVLAMIRDAKILAPVALPARVELEARIERSAGGQVEGHARVRVSARCGETTVLRAELVFAMIEAPPGAEAAVQARRERVARWMAS
jgi:3-hydroxymyristoyl/3-hydroxydecanoyl-(acyl carrier protein) dehydratase